MKLEDALKQMRVGSTLSSKKLGAKITIASNKTLECGVKSFDVLLVDAMNVHDWKVTHKKEKHSGKDDEADTQGT